VAFVGPVWKFAWVTWMAVENNNEHNNEHNRRIRTFNPKPRVAWEEIVYETKKQDKNSNFAIAESRPASPLLWVSAV